MINQRIFSANVGDSSVGIAGPDAIEQDIDNLLANDQELLGTLNDHETQINSLDADVIAHKAESASKHIKESGSNENGSYIRFDDGTQICTAKVSVDISTIGTKTYITPASFVAISDKAVIITPSTLASVAVRNNYKKFLGGYMGTSAQSYSLYVEEAGEGTTSVMITIIGRWK